MHHPTEVGWLARPPRRLPPYQTVFDYFSRWRRDGTWERIYHPTGGGGETLHKRLRQEQGREESPSAVSIYSQSVKTTEMGGERGYDGAKQLVGRKRFLCVDTEGFPVGVHITAASVAEREGAKQILVAIKDELPRLKKLWVDGGLDGAPFAKWAEQVGGWVVELVHKLGQEFAVLPRRWVARADVRVAVQVAPIVPRLRAAV